MGHEMKKALVYGAAGVIILLSGIKTGNEGVQNLGTLLMVMCLAESM
jgi:hypothetical protein